VEALDYVGDHPNVASVPFPGRRTALVQQTFTSELVYDGTINELEMTLPAFMLKGHDADGWRAPQDFGFAVSVPTYASGAPLFQLLGAWYRIEEVERHESVGPDWTVKRISGSSWQTIDVKGNWAGTPGQVFTTQHEFGTALTTGQLALADAGRRAGLTKQFSGTAIVEFDPSVYTGVQSQVASQPNIGQVLVGKNGTNASRIFWRLGTPSTPGALTPVDGLIIRTPPVPDGYRDGNARASLLTPGFNYDYDGSFVDTGTISYYGIRAWCDEGGTQCFFSDNTGGKPGQRLMLDLHDVQMTGSLLNDEGNPKAAASEFKFGGRLGGLRFDMRRVRIGRAQEHGWYTTSPQGDSQMVDVQNDIASNFYPLHVGVSPPALPRSFHQFVTRTCSCPLGPPASTPGATPPGYGTLLTEDCISRGNNGGTDFKCVHTLGSIINRRCTTFASTGAQRAIQFTVEHFNFVAGSAAVSFGVDYSMGTWDSYKATVCTKGGGSGLPNPAQPYPTGVPGNGYKVYCFTKIVVEDLVVNGTYGNTLCQLAGAHEIIIDRGNFLGSSKRPVFGLWEWGWDSAADLGSWFAGGVGAFDNHSVYFRNVGSSPHAFYAPGVSSNNGVAVSRLAVYGNRANSAKPGGTGIPSGPGNPAYLTVAQLSAMATAGNLGYPPWPQTQKPDVGAVGEALGHGWVYPCMTAPNFSDPVVYGGYWNNARRYPNLNTLHPAATLGMEFPAPSVSVSGETGVNVTAGDTPLSLEVTFPAPTVTATIFVTAGATPLLLSHESLGATVTAGQVVTAGDPALTLSLVFPDPIVTTAVAGVDAIDFSLYPAIMGLLVQEPDVLTDAPRTGDGSTDSVSMAGAASGGVS
jgi:hypothetical protein